MVLVVGATGTLGGRIVQRLLAKGEVVRILVRQDSPSVELAAAGMATPLDALIAAGAEPVYGDLTDPASLAEACDGVETVVTTATSTKRQPPDTIERVDLQGTLNLIDAARSQGVGRFVYTSLYGSALDHPAPLFHSKAVCETRLAESGMDYVILQPDLFMEVWIGMVVGMPLQAGQPVTLVGRGDHRHSFVSEADVAAIAVAAAMNARTPRERILIGGPEAHTWTEVVDVVGAAMGDPLPRQYVETSAEVPLLPPLAGALLAGSESYESLIDMEETTRRYGVTLTTLEAFAAAAFGVHA